MPRFAEAERVDTRAFAAGDGGKVFDERAVLEVVLDVFVLERSRVERTGDVQTLKPPSAYLLCGRLADADDGQGEDEEEPALIMEACLASKCFEHVEMALGSSEISLVMESRCK